MSSREEVLQFLGEDWTRLQAKITEALRSDIRILNTVNDYILSNSGKMLRPVVTLMMAGACSDSGCTENTYSYAAAAELLHNATLLHDDVADESDTRRGIPTLRSKMGPSYAVLVGDFWLSRAVDKILEATYNDRVLKIFSKTLSDLAEGEMLQLEKAGEADTTLKDYLRIIYCKTASLFEASGISGAISVNAPERYVDAARKYSEALGTAFQIKDDILDYDGDGELGKPVGIDLLEKKITLPLLCAMEGSGREMEIRKSVLEIDKHPENCDEIRKFVADHDGVRKAGEILSDYVQKAIDALEVLPESKYRDYLADIARFNTIRTK